MKTKLSPPILTAAKIIVFFLSLFIFLELGMRVTGIAIRSEYKDKREIDLSDNSIRILAIGESTTDDFWANRMPGPWPRQLETMLREGGVKAQVFNEGRAGIKTQMILYHLPEWLDRYRPHIVISMMGINDSGFITYNKSFNEKYSTLTNMRVAKLFSWIYQASRSLLYREITSEIMMRDSEKKAYFKEYKKIGVDPLISKYQSKMPHCKLSEILRYIAREVEPLVGENTHKDAMHAVEQAFLRCPQNAYNFRWYYAFSSNRSKTDPFICLRHLDIFEQFGHNINIELLTANEPCLEQDIVRKRIGRFYEAKGIVPGEYMKSSIAQSYRQLYQELKKRNISYISMQYPTQSIDRIIQYFTNDPSALKNITFISNEKNFSDALKRHKREEIFEDNFQQTWGHTTLFGHGLIAKELLTPTLEIIKKRSN